MARVLVIINAFFNVDWLERTIISIQAQKMKPDVKSIDIILLENPSKYSKEIHLLSEKFNLTHYICSKNVAGRVFQVWIHENQTILYEYDYICITEGDVVLDNGVVTEAIGNIQTMGLGMCYTGLKLQLPKYRSFQNLIDLWVPKPEVCSSYCLGETGFQFLVWKPKYLHEFIEAIMDKRIVIKIARGVPNYDGPSDSGLKLFNMRNHHLLVQTKYNKLDHIGWEENLGWNDEYRTLKNTNLSQGKIRVNYKTLSDISFNTLRVRHEYDENVL